ncbi:oxidoreductase [Pasteurellaceae bacterium 22721_9_1]
MNKLNLLVAAEFELCEKVVEFLEQSQIAVEKLSIWEIYPFSEEQGIRFNNRAVEQLSTEDLNWSNYQYLLFAGDVSQAAQIADAAEAGVIVIDMKAICASISGVPVVVPNVNDEQLANLSQRNIVCLPDPQVSQLALVLAQTLQQAEIHSVFATSLLPTSYTNSETVEKLAGQTARLLNGIPLEDNEPRFAFDVFPHSMASLTTQFQKIFPSINVVFHSIQVPVFYGLAQKVTLVSNYGLDTENFMQNWRENDFIQVEQEKMTPVLNGEREAHEEKVKLHISDLSAVENGVEFWTVADDQRFSLAFLTVQLLEKMSLSPSAY